MTLYCTIFHTWPWLLGQHWASFSLAFRGILHTQKVGGNKRSDDKIFSIHLNIGRNPPTLKKTWINNNTSTIICAQGNVWYLVRNTIRSGFSWRQASQRASGTGWEQARSHYTQRRRTWGTKCVPSGSVGKHACWLKYGSRGRGAWWCRRRWTRRWSSAREPPGWRRFQISLKPRKWCESDSMIGEYLWLHRRRKKVFSRVKTPHKVNHGHWSFWWGSSVFSGSRQTNGSALTFSDKEVEHCDDNRVPTEHVVSTRLDACQRHPEPTPDRKCPLYLGVGVIVSLRGNKTEAVSANENHGGSIFSLIILEIWVKSRFVLQAKRIKK